MLFTPRLSQILFLLLNSDKPIPASELALQLQISRRTIFRELKNIDNQLIKYGISLNAKSRKGIILEGDEAAKKALLNILKLTDYFDPRDKEERQNKLILELLKQDEPKKIYYYSRSLQVSDTTISNDMETIQHWFNKYNINLMRKPGFGIKLESSEINFRKAIINYIYENVDKPLFQDIKNINNELITNSQNKVYELLNKDIMLKVIKVLEKINDEKKIIITENSFMFLVVYLSIMVDRIKKGRNIFIDKEISKEIKKDENYIFTIKIINELQKEFCIDITPDEVDNVYIYIEGSKLQYADKSNSLNELMNEQYDITCMAYEIINNYDEMMAYELKQDESFIYGLVAHLKPTITRLKYGLEIDNPFQEEIKSLYPEIYKKTKIASRVITDKLGYTIPESEIGLLALHFGAIMVRLNDRKKPQRIVNVGVICTSGIGISRLLSSRLSAVFKNKINVRALPTMDLDTNKIEDIDFFISTFKLNNIDKPYICVNPMLSEKDLNEINNLIDMYSFKEMSKTIKKSRDSDIFDTLDKTVLISQDISSIINNFDIYNVDSNLKFNEVVKISSEILGNTSENIRQIYVDLFAREEISTQVIPEYQIVLLHSRTRGVEQSKFIVIRPDNGHFKNSYFSEAQAVIVILVPMVDMGDNVAMSSITNGIFENERFLNLIKVGEKDEINEYIKQYLQQYAIEYFKEIY